PHRGERGRRAGARTDRRDAGVRGRAAGARARRGIATRPEREGRMSATLQERMKRVIRQDIQSMHGYAVQPSAGMVKIDTMENPFQLPPALRAELGARLAEVALNRYPADRGDVLRATLAEHAKMPEGCDIMLGNG